MNIVLFDGVCNLCNKTVQTIIQQDQGSLIHFAAQQTPTGLQLMKQYFIPAATNSVVFIKAGTVYYKSDAVIQIAKLLNGCPTIFKYIAVIPKFIRDFVYDLVAANRYLLFGKRNTCMVPSEKDKTRFI